MLLDCSLPAGADDAVRHIPAELDGHTLLVTDTRSPHTLVDGQYEARRRDCEAAATAAGVPSLRSLGPEDLAALMERVTTSSGAARATSSRRTSGSAGSSRPSPTGTSWRSGGSSRPGTRRCVTTSR